MKKAFLLSVLLIFAFAVLALSGCKEEDEEKEAALQFASFLTTYTSAHNGYRKNVGEYNNYLYFYRDDSIDLKKDKRSSHDPSVRIAQYDKIKSIITVKEINQTTYFFEDNKTHNYVVTVGEEIDFVDLGGEKILWKN
jgi:hypothetical protein